MGHGKAKQPADIYRSQMETAAKTAETISPEEQEIKDYNSKLWNIYTGKDKFELSKLPNANVMMSLYNGAKEHSDSGRVGKGLMFGDAKGAGYNPNLIASINAQNQSERERDAAGQLEQRVSDTFGGLEGKYMGLAQSDQDRRDDNFNRYAQMYGMEINKPKKPKWWEQLLGGVAGVGASWASGGFKLGGGNKTGGIGNSTILHENLHNF
jgi:hypothetical protein